MCRSWTNNHCCSTAVPPFDESVDYISISNIIIGLSPNGCQYFTTSGDVVPKSRPFWNNLRRTCSKMVAILGQPPARLFQNRRHFGTTSREDVSKRQPIRNTLSHILSASKYFEIATTYVNCTDTLSGIVGETRANDIDTTTYVPTNLPL